MDTSKKAWPIGGGSGSAGRRLKKSPKRGAHHRLRRRKRIERTPAPLRTWAPRGQTPVLQYHFNWKTLSAMAGMTWWNFYFRLFPGTSQPQVIEFLQHLLRHMRGKLLVIWDGLPGHRSRVRDFMASSAGADPGASARLCAGTESGRVPVGHCKQHEFPNFCPQNFGQLSLSPQGSAADA